MSSRARPQSGYPLSRPHHTIPGYYSCRSVWRPPLVQLLQTAGPTVGYQHRRVSCESQWVDRSSWWFFSLLRPWSDWRCGKHVCRWAYVTSNSSISRVISPLWRNDAACRGRSPSRPQGIRTTPSAPTWWSRADKGPTSRSPRMGKSSSRAASRHSGSSIRPGRYPPTTVPASRSMRIASSSGNAKRGQRLCEILRCWSADSVLPLRSYGLGPALWGGRLEQQDEASELGGGEREATGAFVPLRPRSGSYRGGQGMLHCCGAPDR